MQCIEEEEGARACVVRGRQRSCLHARSRAQKSNAAGWPRRATDRTVLAGDAPAMGRDGDGLGGQALTALAATLKARASTAATAMARPDGDRSAESLRRVAQSL